MKTTRQLPWLVLSCAMVAVTVCAQEEVNTESLAKSAGFWKTTRETPDGQERLVFEWHRYAPELDAVVHWAAQVDPESKEVVSVDLRYFGVRGEQKQVQGLVISSSGMVAEALGGVTEEGMFAHGHGAIPGGGRIAANVRWIFAEDKFTAIFTDLVGPEGYLAAEMREEFEKLDYSNMREMFEGEGLRLEPPDNPAPGLAPLARVLGRWEVAGSDGETQLEIRFRYGARKRWILERWSVGNGGGGLNLSGIDPASGRLALWSVNGGFIGRYGHWDILSDTRLGQVQGRARLVRDFTGDTFAAHWQDLRDGIFADRAAGRYTAKQTSGPPAARRRSAANADWLELPEASAEAYAQLEGSWERPIQIGNSEGRAVKSHRGGKTVVSYFDPDDNLVRQHTSEYKLKRVDDHDVFVYFNRRTTVGADRPRANDIARYSCRVEGDKFFEEHGSGRNARTLVWTRSDETVEVVQTDEGGATPDKLFILVNYMKVPEGGEERYRDVERVWKKVHQARKEAGLILDWALLKVRRPGADSTPYQYATMAVVDSLDKLDRLNTARVSLNARERQVMRQTGAARDLLGGDIWESELAAMPGRGPQDAAPFFMFGFMKSKDEQAHMELEQDTYRKVWAERAKAGEIWNWSIWSRHSGRGLYEDDPPFNMISVVSFPKGAEGPQIRGSFSRGAQAAFPDDTPEQLQERLGRADEVRALAGYEIWTMVDSTSGADEGAAASAGPSAATSRSAWQEEQWEKLTGVWRAPQPNGGYRIKRITPGHEILEVYDAEGNLTRQSQADMSIRRQLGLNFFTIRNWRSVDGGGRTPSGRSYTSIYKVHDGKWYEQLRGIFESTADLAPDQFLVYEQLEE